MDDAAHAAIVASTEPILRPGGFDLGLHALVGHLRGQSPWDVDGHVALKRSRDGAYRGRVGYVVLREDVYAGVADMVVDPGGDGHRSRSRPRTSGARSTPGRGTSPACPRTKNASRAEFGSRTSSGTRRTCFRASGARIRRRSGDPAGRRGSRLYEGTCSPQEVARSSTSWPISSSCARWLGSTRRHWSPQAGRGSQDTSLDLHEALWSLFGTCASGLRRGGGELRKEVKADVRTEHRRLAERARYVDVSVRHRTSRSTRALPDDVKASLTANYGIMSAADADRAWQEAMDVLEGEAVDEARRLWKLRRRTT